MRSHMRQCTQTNLHLACSFPAACNFMTFSWTPGAKGLIHLYYNRNNPAGIYLLKVSKRNTRARCEICSKLTIKIPERRHCIIIVNFEHILHLVLVFILLTLSRKMPVGVLVYSVVTNANFIFEFQFFCRNMQFVLSWEM